LKTVIPFIPFQSATWWQCFNIMKSLVENFLTAK
jgi:hypothetical protein